MVLIGKGKDPKTPEEWEGVVKGIDDDLKDGQSGLDDAGNEVKSRLTITKLFLTWYFSLICGSFAFSLVYNFFAAIMNLKLAATNKDLIIQIPYLDVSNTVQIITTTLSSGFGFVMGYYFRNK